MPQGSNTVFKATRYASDYPGFEGRDLTPGDPIELYPTGIEVNENSTPGSFVLGQNYPNPFNAQTRIRYNLSESGRVRLAIYDLLGREVAIVEDDYKSSGEYDVLYDASGLSSGIYFYQLKIGRIVNTRRMILLK